MFTVNKKFRSPLVSVIVVGEKSSDFENIKLHLSRQRFRDFELITEIGGTIPEAWNLAVRRARGQYLVFTETDARPMSEYWLDELVFQMSEDNLIVKGLEVVGTPWNLCNVIMKREVFERLGFDESYLWSEDTDLFCRLSALSYRLEKREIAPVFHGFCPYTKKALKRAFRYGMYWMRIRHRYNPPIEKANFGNLFRQCLIPLTHILGMCAGFFYYWKERKYRKNVQFLNKPLLSAVAHKKHAKPEELSQKQPTKTSHPQTHPIRVLYIAPLPPTRSGIASYANDYYQTIKNHEKQIEIKTFPEVNQRPCTPNQIVQEIVKLHQYLRDWMPDIIHIETGYGLLREFYLLLSLPAERPYSVFVTAHDPPCLAGEPLRFLGKANPAIEYEKGILSSALISQNSFELEKKAYQHTDVILVLSEKGKACLKQQLGSHEGLRVIPHGVTLPSTFNKSFNGQLLRLLYFGFWHKDKGVDFLLNALRLLHDHSLEVYLAGEPYLLTANGTSENATYRSKIIQQIEDKHFKQNVVVKGYIQDESLEKVFKEADMLVLPYRDSGIASTSGVLVRGMAYGLPIICTNVRALPELIKHNQTGLLVSPDSPQALADSIKKLISNPDLRIRLGIAAREMITTKHQWPSVAAQAQTIYQEFRK
jgi:glycosyltransferase involved in cell wall biosynthesis